jgi:hypothetical protein
MRAVQPSLSTASTSAPAARRREITSKWPYFAANMRAVFPSLSTVSSLAPAASAARTMLVFPPAADGDWRGEIAEIKARFGWRSVDEAGKYYGPDENDFWRYYWVYAQGRYKGKAKTNAALRMACRGSFWGDIIVVKSGPTDCEDMWKGAILNKSDLADTILFGADHEASEVFARREMKRFAAKTGMPVPSAAKVKFVVGPGGVRMTAAMPHH